MFSAARQLQERSGFRRCRTRLSSAAEQITGCKIAAVHRVMRHHLEDAPIRVAEIRSREPLRRFGRVAHPRSFDKNLELDVDSAGASHER